MLEVATFRAYFGNCTPLTLPAPTTRAPPIIKYADQRPANRDLDKGTINALKSVVETPVKSPDTKRRCLVLFG